MPTPFFIQPRGQQGGFVQQIRQFAPE